jgi:hypothetical protein
MNKRATSIVLLIFILASLLININFISAQTTLAEGTQKIGTEIWNTLTPILKFLFNIQEGSDGTVAAQTFLSFIFAFIIVLVFLLLAAKNIPLFDEYPGLSYFIIIVASLLGIRGIAQISPSIMSDIFMPYSVAALSIINGAIIVGWFVIVNIGMDGPRFTFVRRFLWILFGVTFIGVWWLRTFSTEGITALMQWIYIITFILSLVMALIDGTIQGFFAKMEAEKIRHIGKVQRRAAYKSQIKAWEGMIDEGTLNKNDFETLKKNIQQKAKVLGLKGEL